MSRARLAFLAFAGAVVGACGSARTPPENLLTPVEAMALPRPPADYRIEYGPDSLEFGELRLPRGQGPFPVAIVIHGGCWLAGYADQGYMSSLADTLRRIGYATWNIQYRSVDRPGGGWPGTLQDVGAAADYLRVIADSLPLDTTRVFSIGHSAGGHLALWLAARHRIDVTSPLYTRRPLPVVAAISLGGPGDLRYYVDSSSAQISDCTQPVAPLLGGVYVTAPDNWRNGSPAELLPLGVKQRLIAGEWDAILPPRLGREYETRARKAGDDVKYVEVPNEGHFEVVAPGTEAWAAVEREVEALVPLAGTP